ncbi:hypothetical protein MPNT_30084 [Candidatus Methylacidithermus pantelleriae]|uniref:Uncharacterized protein n=2 Tax=Candidatus Methylacidithermus pantelleriae TaxID=2744239 RepID=A0A8J2BTG9_9BACT|nr:hypothetical protein MPNT_30084 [Candidatus Methylacidithermus pantelleriae]
MNGFVPFLGTVLRAFLLVKARTQGNHPFIEIAHDIVGPLIGLHHQDGSTLRGQCRFLVLEPEAHQPVALLDQNDANLPMRDLPNELSTMALHPGADLLDSLNDPQRLG